MIKRFIVLMGVSIVTLSILFSGCATEAEENDDSMSQREIIIRDNESEEYNDMYNVSLTVKDENTLIYEIETFNDHVIETGRPYSIDKLNDNGEWEMLDLELMFTMELIIVSADNPFSQEIDISELGTGEYRVSKHLMDEEGNTIEDLGTVEFEIRD